MLRSFLNNSVRMGLMLRLLASHPFGVSPLAQSKISSEILSNPVGSCPNSIRHKQKPAKAGFCLWRGLVDAMRTCNETRLLIIQMPMPNIINSKNYALAS